MATHAAPAALRRRHGPGARPVEPPVARAPEEPEGVVERVQGVVGDGQEEGLGPRHGLVEVAPRLGPRRRRGARVAARGEARLGPREEAPPAPREVRRQVGVRDQGRAGVGRVHAPEVRDGRGPVVRVAAGPRVLAARERSPRPPPRVVVDAAAGPSTRPGARLGVGWGGWGEAARLWRP